MRKKIGSILMVAVLTLSMSVSAFAADAGQLEQRELRNKVVEIIASSDSAQERDAMLSELLQETPLAPSASMRAAAMYDGDGMENIVLTGMPEIVESVVIDETTQVDFYETGDFGIKEIENLGATDIAVPFASSYKYTDTYRTSYTIKNVFGGKIIETYVKGYFRYNGTSVPTAYLEDAGYSKGTLIFWDCSSWEEDVGKNTRDKTAYCYADAYYDWTLDVSLGGKISGSLGGSVTGEVNGSIKDGLTIQDCNVYLKLICNKSGKVSASVSLED